MILKANLMTESDMNRALKRMSHQILESNHGANNIVILGIKRRGLPLAQLLAANIKLIEGIDVPVGELDISLYRDDVMRNSIDPIVSDCNINFKLTGKDIILVDDVLYTGRTVRAALDAISKYGRASTVQLAVLIDRGHRELPIRADYVGKNVPTSRDELISVCVKDIDGENGVKLFSK
ncbi:MAG: bifunctional pyr operon transcriptional regulator/uracil phosphoribosyltransferase PyrR [Clostridiales bacterium]|nr:bifunctional pyr operon transcriptional regulator/uracil phosphoribosyltransferase PyrR [Bacillota bacterium]MEE0516691.1 bifunctional pyr operon transcriptional regulator/uracil phosphoribosyltransferase PyrR [Anaerovoracaceae bacterium]PWL94988.1 MAG: bifunctional pyr operon transcriptional regulator/uracil phosphoribosyltransferase PyrR [Clostridiales bacterium]